jgi:hypothetical protein
VLRLMLNISLDKLQVLVGALVAFSGLDSSRGRGGSVGGGSVAVFGLFVGGCWLADGEGFGWLRVESGEKMVGDERLTRFRVF